MPCSLYVSFAEPGLDMAAKGLRRFIRSPGDAALVSPQSGRVGNIVTSSANPSRFPSRRSPTLIRTPASCQSFRSPGKPKRCRPARPDKAPASPVATALHIKAVPSKKIRIRIRAGPPLLESLQFRKRRGKCRSGFQPDFGRLRPAVPIFQHVGMADGYKAVAWPPHSTGSLRSPDRCITSACLPSRPLFIGLFRSPEYPHHRLTIPYPRIRASARRLRGLPCRATVRPRRRVQPAHGRQNLDSH
jgi:hypothetical protein